MCKGKRLSINEQCKIDIYYEQGWSFNKIAKHINRSNGVVSKYINIGDNYNKKVYKKRKLKLTLLEIQRILNDSSNKKTSCGKIKYDNKLDVHRSTIRRTIKNSSFIKYRKLKKNRYLQKSTKLKD